MARNLLLFLAVTIVSLAQAQDRVLTVGFQYRPIIASEFFGTGPINLSHNDSLSGNLTQKLGHSFGMVIRKGFTKKISLEIGINYTRRNYDLFLKDDNYTHDPNLDFGIVAYEVPVQGLYYVQFTQNLFMDVAGGFAMVKFASDVHSQSSDGSVYQLTIIRNSFFAAAFTANVGFEYRTKKAGYFYLGASYHKPFKDMAKTRIEYQEDYQVTFFEQQLNGTYLTIDLRYFFHEKPQKD